MRETPIQAIIRGDRAAALHHSIHAVILETRLTPDDTIEALLTMTGEAYKLAGDGAHDPYPHRNVRPRLLSLPT